jgi:hypothetical protein
MPPNSGCISVTESNEELRIRTIPCFDPHKGSFLKKAGYAWYVVRFIHLNEAHTGIVSGISP